jgi:hypothetical protein
MMKWIAAAVAVLCAVAPYAASAQDVAGPRYLLVLLRSEQGRVRLVSSQEVAGNLPRAEARDATQGWSFEALNDKNEVVVSGNLPDPHVVRGVFMDDKGHTSGVQLSSANDQTFAVRVPYGTKAIVIYGSPARALAAQGKGKANAVLGRINL